MDPVRVVKWWRNDEVLRITLRLSILNILEADEIEIFVRFLTDHFAYQNRIRNDNNHF